MLKQHSPWLSEINTHDDEDDGGYVDDGIDNSTENTGELFVCKSQCELVILQCDTFAPGLDNDEKCKLNEILSNSGNKNFEKKPQVFDRLSLNHLPLAMGDVFHFIGHSTSSLDGSGAAIFRASSDRRDFVQLSDSDLSRYLGKLHGDRPLRLSLIHI